LKFIGEANRRTNYLQGRSLELRVPHRSPRKRNIIVEIKSVEQLMPIHEAQLMTYLRLLQKKVGLLINFNVPVLKKGIVRRVL
jgi:hypothetical protein